MEEKRDHEENEIIEEGVLMNNLANRDQSQSGYVFSLLSVGRSAQQSARVTKENPENVSTAVAAGSVSPGEATTLSHSLEPYFPTF